MKELALPSLSAVLRLCLSYGLELAFFKTVKIAGKERKCWSQATRTHMYVYLYWFYVYHVMTHDE